MKNRILKLDKSFDIIRVIGLEKETFAQDINRISGITFSHIVQIVRELEERKYLTKVEDGRKFKLKLTDKGNKLYTILKQLDVLLK
jgi:DNA-binding MarR family transcriptional regulator